MAVTVNKELSRIFDCTAQVLELLGVNRFRVLAFQRASRALDDQTEDVTALAQGENALKLLTAIDGVGKGIAERIIEYVKTGKIQEHEKVVSQVPAGLIPILDIPGLGPKTVALLWKKADVQSLDDLKAKLQTDALSGLPGLGNKKLENIRKSIAFSEVAGERVRLGEALPLAEWVVEQLQRLRSVKQISFAGSLRRGRDTIGDLDIIVAASDKDHRPISDTFVNLEPVTEILVKGTTKSSVRTSHGMQLDLRIVSPEHYGAALMYFTGSKEHNIQMRERAIKQGTKLNEYGLHRGDHMMAGATEEDVFGALGLDWIPPEIREARGEIALAETASLPDLIRLEDIKADLHTHTTASDGTWSIWQLAEVAAGRGFHSIAITDHSKSQALANGLTAERLEKHIEDVHAVAAELKEQITIFAGSEVDILADGKLDYPNSLLSELDVVVASPHVALSQSPDKATSRLLRAIENPYVTILGHPTGRLINRREGLNPDMRKVIDAAAQRGVALELNANSWRLDLRDAHARATTEAGVKLAINTDAHGPLDFDQLRYGVMTARRAGATTKDVVNCMSRAPLLQWLKSTR